MTNFTKRVLTSFVLLPISAYAIFEGGWIFLFFVTSIILVSYFELSKLIKKKNTSSYYSGFIFVALLPISAFLNIEFFINISLFLVVIYIIGIIYKKITFIDFWSSYIFIIFYAGFGLSFAIIIRNLETGLIFSIIPIVLSSVNDIMAYIVGKNFGQNLAFPNVSPNKTYEGSFGGILSTILISFLLFNLFNIDIGIYKMVFIGLIISIFGILGDFFESLIKRKSGIKDTGNILPGHGGMLDRVDSIIFVLPIFYLIISIIIVN